MKANYNLGILSEQHRYLDQWAKEAEGFVVWAESITKQTPRDYTDNKSYTFYKGPPISILPAKWFVNYGEDTSFKNEVNEIFDAFNTEMYMKDSSEIVIGKELDDVNNALYALWKTTINTALNENTYLLSMCNADCSKTTIGILLGNHNNFFKDNCKMPPARHTPIKGSRKESYTYLHSDCTLNDFGDYYRKLVVSQQIGAELILHRLFNMHPESISNSDVTEVIK